MKRKSLTPLGETEMEVLHIVWELGSASVGEVRKRVQQSRAVAYTTVMTVMRNLAEKGYLRFERDGNSYVYSAERQPSEVRASLLDDLLRKVFRGSPLALVESLVQDEAVSAAELQQIRSLIDGMEGTDVK